MGPYGVFMLGMGYPYPWPCWGLWGALVPCWGPLAMLGKPPRRPKIAPWLGFWGLGLPCAPSTPKNAPMGLKMALLDYLFGVAFLQQSQSGQIL